jgi:hypothetical protein
VRASAAVALALLLFLSTSPHAADVALKLVDVAAQAGVTLLNIGGGPAKDYIIDEVGSGAAAPTTTTTATSTSSSSTVPRARSKIGGDPLAALYRNDGNGKFTDVTARSGITRRGWGMGVCVADYDNDGFDDVYVTSAVGGNALYRNGGNGTFADVTRQAGVADAGWSTGCAFGDYDRDGSVDLYVATTWRSTSGRSRSGRDRGAAS